MAAAEDAIQGDFSSITGGIEDVFSDPVSFVSDEFANLDSSFRDATGIGLFGSDGLDDISGKTAADDAEDAAEEAAATQGAASKTNIEESARQFDITRASLERFEEPGVRALGQQQALLGLSGQDEQQAAFAAFNESPGQAFLRERAERSLVRQAGALGGLGGGNVRSELARQGVGFAQQDFQNQFGRLGQLAGQGQAAATNIGQFGQQAIGQQGQFRTAGSEARASGIFGAQQARAQQQGQTNQLIGTGLAFLCDARLKTEITEIDRDQLGGIYTFKYIDNDALFVGRMAQELLETRPEAVSLHETGYYQVTEEFAPELIAWH